MDSRGASWRHVARPVVSEDWSIAAEAVRLHAAELECVRLREWRKT
jgi:hypothetical protein